MDNDLFQRNVEMLAAISPDEERMLPANDAPLPSVERLAEMVRLCKMLVFPGFFDKRRVTDEVRAYHIGVNLERLFEVLSAQIGLALLSGGCSDGHIQERAVVLTRQFVDYLPELKRLLFTDVEAIFINDPAARTYGEVIFSYPVIQAMLHYRIAHVLADMDVPVLPRIITEQAHSATGIDIHPHARIGEYFSIDHGTGVVIGETCEIGNHVMLYQGVTLGAKNYRLEPDRQRQSGCDVKRHPTLEDNVTVYSNSTLLGPITIGHDTVVGGNIWLTHSVPPFSRLLQGKEQDVTFSGGLGI